MKLRTSFAKRNKATKLSGLETLEDKRLFAADLVSIAPVDNSTDVSPSTALVMTFSEAVEPGAGTGNIVLRNSEDGSLIDVINVNSDQVTFDGTAVTVSPSADLPSSTDIMVHVDAGAIQDQGTDSAMATIFSEDFESIPLENSLLVPTFDDYALTMTGMLDVTEAGDYTFGINSDDGQALFIDVDQDGLDFGDDEIIYDDTTHGRQDRLSTCGDADQSCEGTGDGPITLEVGQYEFTFLYFERGGGSGGEFFYAKGNQEIWNADAFALVGDSSQGIGVVDGVLATTYKEEEGFQVGNLSDAEALIDTPELKIGEATLEVADVAENAGGRFSVDVLMPGAVDWVLANDPNPNDFSNEGPLGWTNDNSDLIDGGADEYRGWVWLDKDFWIAQQGDQSRTDYELAEGTVLVADPDAHDDFIDNGGQDAAACLEVLEFGPECGLFTASVSTPEIYLNNVAANSTTLIFDSSWWDEDTQSAEARVEFFDASGASISENVLLRWESIADSDNYKPQLDPDTDVNARNEHVEISLENPAEAASMVVTFDMPYATNDWWWAVDNVMVTGDLSGSAFPGVGDDSFTFTTGEGGGSVGLPGDIDGNGSVDFTDFLLLSESFGQDVEPGSNGDFDSSGTVDFSDFLVLSANFGTSG